MTPDPGPYIALALELARTARGFSSPNPPVGAVIVRDGIIVGQGATQPIGGPHAEVVALRAAGELARGATLYVTLEPHHFHGHTPPCTEAIIAAGISQVVVALLDPNPRVTGQGIARLRAAGLTVEVGPGAAEAARLVAPFAYWLRTRQPLVTAKFAMSLDGKIATRAGHSQWITGPEARAAGHHLRQASDVILVGSGTVLADDPQLTTRLPDLAPAQMRHPLRVVADAHGRTPLTARLLVPHTPGTVLIATTAAADPAWREALVQAGNEVAVLAADPAGHVDLHALWNALGARGCTTLLIEGGSTLLGSIFAAALVQRVVAFMAPIVIGSSQAPGPVGDPGIAHLTEALRLRWTSHSFVGEDIILEAEVIGEDPPPIDEEEQ